MKGRDTLVRAREVQTAHRANPVNRFPRKALSCAIGIALACGAPGTIMAQQGGEAEAGALEEVYVTARKREERLQDVPMTLSTLGEDELTRIGAFQMADFAAKVPSLTYVERGPARNRIIIRGIVTTSDPDENGTTGLYWDEAPVGEPGHNPDLYLFDVERVEVLKGPQGTLYGAGSMGGTVRVVTNRPDASAFDSLVETQISSTEGGDLNYLVNGMLNVPIVEDELAMRLVGYTSDDSGFIDNVDPRVNENNVNDVERDGARLSLRYTPSDRLTIDGTLIYQNTEAGGAPDIDPAFETDGNDLVQARFQEEPLHDKMKVFNLEIGYEFDSISLLSATSYSERDFGDFVDISVIVDPWETPEDDSDFPFSLYVEEDRDVFTQEVRLASDTDSALQWIGGMFYSKSKSDGNESNAYADLGGPELDPVFLSTTAGEVEQIAAFGEMTYNFSDQWAGTVGLRWADIKTSFDETQTEFFDLDTVLMDSGSVSDDTWNPKFLVSYTPEDDRLFYASATKGFRAGQPQGTFPQSGACQDALQEQLGLNEPPPGSKSDTLWSYELGAKTTWNDGKVVLNGALFYIDWSNIQTFRNLGLECPFDILVNSGDARSKGAELEWNMRFGDGFSFQGGVNYNDAELASDLEALNGTSGERLPGVPEWTVNAGLEYEFPIATNFGFGRVDFSHIGSSYNDFSVNPDRSKVGGYETVNLRFGMYGDLWDATLFVNNVADERGVVHGQPFARAEPSLTIIRPRTWGVNFRYRFH